MKFKQVQQLLSHNLQFYRKEQGYSQQLLSEKAGISTRLYSQIEQAMANPTLETIYALATSLNVTVGDLHTLKGMRVNLDLKQILPKLAACFDNAPYLVGARKTDGTIVYGNKIALNTFTGGKLKPPFNLLENLQGGVKEMTRNQLVAESNGVCTPYTTFFPIPGTDSIRCYRHYPVMLLPEKGIKPFLTLIYAIPIEQDCELNYLRFCSDLLNCKLGLE